MSTVRTKSGHILAFNLAKMGTIKANDMRCDVVGLIVKEKEILTDYAKNLPFLLDSSFGNNYSSIDDRISNMSREDTYADNVELLSAGYLLGKHSNISEI